MTSGDAFGGRVASGLLSAVQETVFWGLRGKPTSWSLAAPFLALGEVELRGLAGLTSTWSGHPLGADGVVLRVVEHAQGVLAVSEGHEAEATVAGAAVLLGREESVFERAEAAKVLGELWEGGHGGDAADKQFSDVSGDWTRSFFLYLDLCPGHGQLVSSPAVRGRCVLDPGAPAPTPPRGR